MYLCACHDEFDCAGLAWNSFLHFLVLFVVVYHDWLSFGRTFLRYVSVSVISACESLLSRTWDCVCRPFVCVCKWTNVMYCSPSHLVGFIGVINLFFLPVV